MNANLNPSLERLEAELQRLGSVISVGDKDKPAHTLFIEYRPFPNGPIITHVCTWLDTTVTADSIYFRAGTLGTYIAFSAKMIEYLRPTKTTDGQPAHSLKLRSSEAWQNA